MHPWWLMSWAFRQFGLYDSSTDAGKLTRGCFVSLRNIEVRLQSEMWTRVLLIA